MASTAVSTNAPPVLMPTISPRCQFSSRGLIGSIFTEYHVEPAVLKGGCADLRQGDYPPREGIQRCAARVRILVRGGEGCANGRRAGLDGRPRYGLAAR